MSEETILNVSEDASLGKVEIAPGVIEVIAGIATTEIEGVYSRRGNFATDVAERFGLKTHTKGIKVELTDTGVTIDVYVVFNYGVTIPLVAQKVQQNIRQQLKTMTALEIEEINVHVVGVHMDKEESQSE
ncbi:Asp23/Gls24 family envelope stress response protein [Amphibacillus xylanus]|uniref:Putative alkaline shock protein n=1 Tax=Amphibacillus xylanus (strain ATCC 51415 / DSM 6626 / JCM 7361 / LMG 17667 / NBRC 15112 / Ep01) TaxID=698758 RepID=K0IXT4_AMPXN|nr:Asp23/Gls24 family envelope stress response protein [Amphibacillus xylanus]BAM47305.1 putative alkaline shock protein [Amphibacillus xylanus NBRC 15112]